ncbi:MAG: efflux RND transporter periplasmic adaptor subunit [Deltaproteobacteria bacterium]|nr:efflux RND transporter periplasmic adaptor subunit [Deltaproteobacteria bacterium]
MKRVLRVIILLAIALVVALIFRVRHLRSARSGPPGGTGVIEGVDVNVTSRIPTRIVKITVDEGDMVKAGDIVVELDCVEYEAALAEATARLAAAEASLQASNASATTATRNASAAYGTIDVVNSQIAALEAQQRLARLELERAESFYKQGVATSAMVDDARTRYDTLVNQIAAQRASAGATRDQAGALRSAGNAAKAQVAAAQSNLEATRAAIARVQTQVRECRLSAPRSGMVSSRNFEPGEAVQPGSVILTVTDLSEARTRFYLPNADLAAAAPGRMVKVVADAYPKKSFKGTIYHVSPRAEFTPRNVQTRDDRERLVYAVEVRIPNPNMLLRSGMPVEATIEASAR